jgi:hypothetical protein
MAEKNRADLKSFFEAGDRPTQQQFADLIDSYVNRIDDAFVPTLPDASETQKGIVERATLAEVMAGTDTARFVTPEGAKKSVQTFAAALAPVQSVNGLTGNVNIPQPEDSGWINATLLNGFQNYGAPFQGARYRKKAGVVYIEGLIKSGSAGAVIFQLPAGYRPAQQLIFANIYSGNLMARIDVDASGNVIANPMSTAWTNISGISFVI